MQMTSTSETDAPPASAALSPSLSPEHAGHLFTSLYRDLCRLARREVRRNGARDYVSTGTLVHEAWLDIHRRPALQFAEPGRFPGARSGTPGGADSDRRCRTAGRSSCSRGQQCRQWHLRAGFLTAKRG